MATKWMKSLQCKSRALDDVVHHNSSSCKNGALSLRDIVEITKHSKPRKTKPSQTAPFKRPVTRAPHPGLPTRPSNRIRLDGSESFLPSLTELPEGHPSRNVVEIIFHTRWGEKNFPGRIEMVFKVQSLTRTVTRFEDYREVVKSRVGGGGDDHARCIADGNEVMGFYGLGATSCGSAYDTGGGAWAFKGASVCTFSCSGAAHENGGGGKGRRAMLVCRVIAGRVCKRIGCESVLDGRVGYDSVSGEKGELLVFDSHALLPCFLIIYKL